MCDRIMTAVSLQGTRFQLRQYRSRKHEICYGTEASTKRPRKLNFPLQMCFSSHTFVTPVKCHQFVGSSAVSWLRPQFESRPNHLGFVLCNEAMEQGFLLVLRFSPVSIIPSKLHSCSFIYQERYVILSIDTILNKNFKTHKQSFLSIAVCS